MKFITRYLSPYPLNKKNLAKSKNRLKYLLSLGALAIGIPIIYLIIITLSYVKNESILQLEKNIGEYTSFIESELENILSIEKNRAFNDYKFEYDNNKNHKSPLSRVPIDSEIPGLIGHFQLSANGSFSSPVLPNNYSKFVNLNMTQYEYLKRLSLFTFLKKEITSSNLFSNLINEKRALINKNQAKLPTKKGSSFRLNIYNKPTRMGVSKRTILFSKSVTDVRNQKFSLLQESNYKELKDYTEKISSPAFNIFNLGELKSYYAKNKICFFREIVAGKDYYVQGFMVDADKFLKAFIKKSYLLSPISNFTSLDVFTNGESNVLNVTKNKKNRTIINNNSPQRILKQSSFPSPLSFLNYKFSITSVPKSRSLPLISFSSFFIFLMLLSTLAFVYKMIAGQLDIAKQRSDIVSAISHELKTPLTSIRMYGEMLKNNMVPDEAKQKKYYQYIYDESGRLSRLINNILQLSNIQKAKELFTKKELSIEYTFKNISEKLSAIANNNGFDLQITNKAQTSGGTTTIRSNEDALIQIFVALLDNAIKFSKNTEDKEVASKNKVEFTLLKNKEQYIFSIRDFGPGISKKNKKRIFELFYRAEDELTRTSPGTGIGLALVQQIALSLDHKIEVLDKKPGTEFQVII